MGNIKRVLEINKVLKKHKLRRYIFGEKIKDKEEVAKRMRVAFQELGPFFIKFGQFLSVNYMVIPEEFRKEFEKLQDGAGEFPFSKAKAIIEKEFGKKIDELFEKIEEKPIAAASLAQVYRAKLSTGEIVVVKVQRPEAEQLISKDLNVLRFFARRVDKKLRKNNINIYEIIDELEEFLKTELDFEQEAIHADLFKRQELSRYEKIPKVYFHSKKVLVEEYIHGIKISDLQNIHAWGVDKEKVIDNLGKSMFYHIFQDGLFHGDPHPANILVLKDGRIAYLDFGVLGRLQTKVKRAYVNQYKSVLNNDPDKFLEEHFKINKIDKDKVKNYKKLRNEIGELFERHEENKSLNSYDCIANANMILANYKIPDKNKILVLLRGCLALNNLLRRYGLSDKRFDNVVKTLASLDNIPFGATVGPEVLEMDFQKKARNAALLGEMQNFMSLGKINDLGEKLVTLEQNINKKGEVSEEQVYSRGGFLLGLLILSTLGLSVYFYERLLNIASGRAYIVQGAMGLLLVAFIINVLVSKRVKRRKS